MMRTLATITTLAACTARVIELTIVRDDDMLIIGGTYPSSDVPISPCACIDQAHFTATKGHPKATDVVIVRDYHGNVIEPDEWPACRVTRNDWTWIHHEHTHRVSKRGPVTA